MVPTLMEFISRGDGSYVTKPTLMDAGMETWLSVRQVVKMFAPIGEKTIRRLVEDGTLRSRRPSPHKVQVSLQSLLDYKKGIETDPMGFWKDKKHAGNRTFAKPLQSA